MSYQRKVSCQIAGYKVIPLVFAMAFIASSCGGAEQSEQDRKIELHVAQLIDSMSVEEKVGQMTQITLGALYSDNDNGEVAIDPKKLDDAINKYHVGSILNTGGRALTLSEWHGLIETIQDVALDRDVAIPVLYGIDAIHGTTYTKGSTLFPHNIGMAATRSPSMVAAAAAVTAKEVRASGIRWNFDPVLDVARNPLWSRFEETFGEDAYLAGLLGVAAIKAYETDDLGGVDAVASCMKHYVGYSAAANGKDRTPAYIADVQLWENYLPPFEAAVNAGSSTIMINSASVNGMPVHASKYLLTDVLRDRFGFEGLIVTDWEDVIRLHTRHNIAETPREAVKMAVDAGIDMSMVPFEYSFAEHLVDLVMSGEISEARIDQSVAIILRLKIRLGLFENAYFEKDAVENFGRPEYRHLALDAARNTITLLKNSDNVLPLSRNAKVLLAGPGAHNLGALHGSWSYTWQGSDEQAYPEDTQSLAEALGAGGRTFTTMGIAAYDDAANVDTVELARLAPDSEVIVLAIGEPAYAESPGALDDLNLPHDQLRLARAAIATGKPVVLILLEGRPRVLGDIADGAAAVIQAYRPGSQGAQAIVDVLYGDHNPSGILPYSYPQYAGDITPYDRRVLANIQQLTPGSITYGGYKPQWPFGFGLSYSTFDLDVLSLNKDVLVGDSGIEISVTVTNTSNLSGDKVLDLYVSDLYASLSPAHEKLRASTRVSLEGGGSKMVSFTLTKNDLSFVNSNLDRVTEPGRFKIRVGDQTAEFDYLSD